jgi:phage-related protein
MKTSALSSQCLEITHSKPNSQGAIFSSIGRGINSVISAIADVLMAIVGAVTSVCSFQYLINYVES